MKGFDFEIDFRVKSWRWYWRLAPLEPKGEPHRQGDVYASTERAREAPELRMGFNVTPP